MWYFWKAREVITKFLWRYLEERHHLEDRGGTKCVILKQIFKKWDWRAGIRLTWLRIEKGGGQFWERTTLYVVGLVWNLLHKTFWRLEFNIAPRFSKIYTPLKFFNPNWRSLEYKTWDSNTNKTGSTTLKEWTTPDPRNTPSTTNLEEEEIVDTPGNNDNASMPEEVKRPNPWRKKKKKMMMMIMHPWFSS